MTPTSPRLPTPTSSSIRLLSSPAKAPKDRSGVAFCAVADKTASQGPSVAESATSSISLQPLAQLLDQIRGEYLDMPGLKLTLPHAQRLWHLRERECAALLGMLIDAKFLCRNSDGRFARVSELGGIDTHRRMAKAQLERRVYRTTREAAS